MDDNRIRKFNKKFTNLYSLIMGIIQIFIWAIVVISAFIFIKFFLYPYLLRKFVLFTLEKKVKQMSKKYSGKTAEQLKEIAKGISELRKEEKL